MLFDNKLLFLERTNSFRASRKRYYLFQEIAKLCFDNSQELHTY